MDDDKEFYEKGGARRFDPGTSHKAAESIPVTFLEKLVFEAVCEAKSRGATLDELIDMTGLQKVTVSPRLKPLEIKGRIRRLGKRLGKSRRAQTVWVRLIKRLPL